MPRRTRLTEHSAGGPSGAVRAAAWAGITLALASLAVYYLLSSKQAAGEIGLPLDDGWIHVRFAQNLARGQGFSFNPGEPTSTTTSALWTLLLGAAYSVTGEHLLTGIAVNFVLSLLLCAAVYQLALLLAPSRWLALGSAAVVALTVPLPWWMLSGMEPPLYGTLAVSGLALHIAFRRSRGIRNVLPTVVFALAGLARPECFLLFPLAMIDRLVTAAFVEKERHPLWRWAKELAVHVPTFVVIVAPLFVYNYRVTGYPLPTSFYSKLQWQSLSGALASQHVSLAAALLVGPARELGELLVVWAKDNAVLIVPFFFGLVWLVRRVVSHEEQCHRSVIVPMVLIAQPIAWAVVAGYRAPGYQSQRYLANLTPLFLVVGMVGGWWITERVAALRGPGVRAVLFCAVLAASLARQPSHARTYALNVKNTTEMQVTIGRWLRDNAARGSLLAVNDVGAIGVVSDLPVLDLQGLVTPEALEPRNMRHRAAGTAPRALFDFIVEHRPDYLVIFPEWYPELDGRRDLFTPVFGVALYDNITCGAPVMVVYRTVWASEGRRKGGEPS